ncbi:MAG: phenylalanine--tRNA ligase subunit alpha [Candidatus Aenigmarchaeota archaeon]|nr:phenylalanine--tRNA ligase subunit alpha [Candidatus Aenigmarchaeota archaeon]
MDLRRILESLSPVERKVLPFLKDGIELREIIKSSKLKYAEVMRALQWLENKGAIKIESRQMDIIKLGENGEAYLKIGLPEKRFLLSLKGRMSIDELKKSAKLDDDELKVCIGLMKSKHAINLYGTEIEPTNERNIILKHGFPEEKFLRKLPKPLDELTDKEKGFVKKLIKRKDIIKKDVVKLKHVKLTDIGRELISKSKGLRLDFIERLTPTILKNKSWRGKIFRKYDIKVSVPRLNAGKRQPYSEFLEDVRGKLLSLGFKEMEGPIIELEFFNFDALYQPQNHPARDWTSTYRIKEPKYGRLLDKNLVEAVKNAHERGVAGSSGWQYKWSEKIASRLIPRAHDTAISPRYLAKEIEIPGKYFSLVRCYRPDVIDATHGVEFNQLGGFVIDENLSFRHLLGLLKEFVYEITGIKEIRFVPDYFPFTEPSVQISAKHPEFGWMELAGAGVFRPELTIPLGVKQPVIAWGFGIDRLAMLKLGITDIRDLFSRDIEFLRNARKVL